MYYIIDKSTDEAKMHDIIILLEKKIVHHFALWKVLSTALKLYDGINIAVPIITVRQPTTKAVRSSTAQKDCQKCQDSKNGRNFLFELCAQLRLGKFLCLKHSTSLSVFLCSGSLTPAMHHRNNQEHFPAH